MAPIISRAAHERITDYIYGRGYTVEGHEDSYWMGGTQFDYVTREMTIYREETFGPVLSCVHVNSFAEGAQLINDHEFGRQIQVGMVENYRSGADPVSG